MKAPGSVHLRCSRQTLKYYAIDCTRTNHASVPEVNILAGNEIKRVVTNYAELLTEVHDARVKSATRRLTNHAQGVEDSHHICVGLRERKGSWERRAWDETKDFRSEISGVEPRPCDVRNRFDGVLATTDQKKSREKWSEKGTHVSVDHESRHLVVIDRALVQSIPPSIGCPEVRQNMIRRGLTNRASAAGARLAGAPCARSFLRYRPGAQTQQFPNRSARQLQALVRQRVGCDADSQARDTSPEAAPSSR